MSALFSHAMRWEFFDRNPITLVRQSAKRKKTLRCSNNRRTRKALLLEVTGVYRVMVFVAATTGLRVSELLALRWQDCDFEAEEIRLSRGMVRQRETMMKTESEVASPYRWKKGLQMYSRTGGGSAPTTSRGITSSRLWRWAGSNLFGRTALWKNISGLLAFMQRSRSASAGICSGTPTERCLKLRVRTLQPCNPSCGTPTSASRWITTFKR